MVKTPKQPMVVEKRMPGLVINPDAQRIRDRYNLALRQGFHPDKAARIANGEIEPSAAEETVERGFVPPGWNAEAPPEPPKAPDYDELPWPQLRELAEARAPGVWIKSRKQAVAILSSAGG